MNAAHELEPATPTDPLAVSRGVADARVDPGVGPVTDGQAETDAALRSCEDS
jgi:hypothetical protein